MSLTSALALTLVAPISGLAGPADDLGSITFTARQPVHTELSILDVSIAGHVLAVPDADHGEAMVVLDREGDEVERWPVPDAPRALTQTNWSPDGSVVAFDELATEGGSTPSTSRVRTLDVSDGTLAEIDPTHNGAATLDFYPAWSGDGALMFLRANSMPAGMNEPVDLVTQDADGEARSQQVDLTPAQLSDQDGAVLAGRYVATTRQLNGTEVVAINPDGTTQSLMATVFPAAIPRGGSTDGRQLLITPLDSDALELGPLTMLEAGEAPKEASLVDALDAVFQPDGTLVAALEVVNPGPSATGVLVLWDPEANASRILTHEFEFFPLGLVWTVDDQIVAWGLHDFQVIELTR